MLWNEHVIILSKFWQLAVPEIVTSSAPSDNFLQQIENKRPVGLYSPLLIQIIQYCNKCLRVDASKTGWTPNKKVIKGIHLLQFA